MCAECLQGVHVYPHAVCKHCGRVLPAELAPGPCGSCLRKPCIAEATHSLFAYDDVVRRAILQWKLHGDDAAVRWLLHAADRRVQSIVGQGDILIPMPMPLSRMRKSGQHHAANLCHWLADASGADWDWNILRRTHDAPRQSSLSGAQRKKNLRHAFALHPEHQSRLHAYARVWLIDDILTTGASVHFAAKALRQQHVSVHVLTLSRVLKS